MRQASMVLLLYWKYGTLYGLVQNFQIPFQTSLVMAIFCPFSCTILAPNVLCGWVLTLSLWKYSTASTVQGLVYGNYQHVFYIIIIRPVIYKPLSMSTE